jgi:hypothetical protein
VSDLRELGYWLFVTGVFVAIPFLVKRRTTDGPDSSDWRSRLSAWAVDRVTPVRECDPLAEELAKVLRGEKLRRDVQRLQRIIATDMSMSATRQLGNRIAYDWLLRELEKMRGTWQETPSSAAMDSWSVSALPIQSADLRSSHDWQRPPTVETIEIGWRR